MASESSVGCVFLDGHGCGGQPTGRSFVESVLVYPGYKGEAKRAPQTVYADILSYGDDAMSSRREISTPGSPPPYLAAAEAALRHYGLGSARLQFIAHNAGVVYRVEAPGQARALLLKLHVRVGAGQNAAAAQLEAGMQWLAGIAQATGIRVQAPVPAPGGPFVATVLCEQIPIHCTLQHWLDGELPHGPFTEDQMRNIGRMLARLHRYSRQSDIALDGADRYGAETLSEHLRILRQALDRTVFPPAAEGLAGSAVQKVQTIMGQLGETRDVWGAVHGDLHYDNILLAGGDVCPIDFSALRAAHYLYDLGVTLYHTFHQGSAVRQAFLAGYQELVPLPHAHRRYLDAFVVCAALHNLSWNATLPEQAASALFRKNLQQFVFTFCRGVVDEVSFLA